MGNKLSCFPLKRDKGRESDFIRRNWKQLIKKTSKATSKPDAKLELHITKVGKFDEEWELVDIEDDACCLSVTKEHVPSPRILSVSPCVINSPTSSCSSECMDLVDIEDDDQCLPANSEVVASPKCLVMSPPRTKLSPLSPRKHTCITEPITKIDEDKDDIVDKDNMNDKIIGCGDNTSDNSQNSEHKDETTEATNNTSYRRKSQSPDYCIDILYQPYRTESKSYSPSPDTQVVSQAVSNNDSDNFKTQMYADIADIFELILDRVETAYAFREVSDDEDEYECSLTPPQIEGDIYRGAGILKTTQFGDTSAETRRITWGNDVKPPAKDGPDLDPIVAAFAAERSKLVLMRTREQKALLRLARRARRRQAKYCALMMMYETPRSRLPVRVKHWQYERSEIDEGRSYTYKPAPAPKGCRIPVRLLVQNATNNAMSKVTDGGTVWPQRQEDIDSDQARSEYIDQFKRTQLFQQRLRKKKRRDSTWAQGLTPFQRWVIENVGAAVTNTADIR